MKMKIVFFIMLWSFIMTIKIQGQTSVPNGVELSKFVPSSPEAAALGKYGQTEMNLYNGTPSLNIPLYEIKTRDIKVPVSLSYSSSGTKVSELPSRVGLGWTLNAGGAITRTVRSRPDDKEHGYIDGSHAVDAVNNANLNTPAGYILAKQAGNNNIDIEPDMYFINLAGISGKFYFDQDAHIHLIPEQKLNIEYQLTGSGLNKEIRTFSITTLNGIKYSFGGLTIHGNKAFEDVNMPEFFDNVHECRVITAWYITKIVSSYETVSFDYYNRNYDFEYFTTVNKYHLYDLFIPSISPCGYEGMWGIADPPSKVPHDNVLRKIQHLNAVSIKSITTNNCITVFEELPDERNDQPGLHALNSITVQNVNSAVIRNFVFSYNYNNNRLALEKLVEGFPGASNDDGTPVNNKEHDFNYFEGSSPGLPADRNSFSQDHWGYFNGVSNTTLVPPLIHSFGVAYPNLLHQYHDVYLEGADRYPKSQFSSMGVLKSVQYPTGGTTEFEYEQNTEINFPHDYSVQETKNYFTGSSVFVNQVIGGISTDIYSQPLVVYNAVGKKIWMSIQALNMGSAEGELWRKDGNGNYTDMVLKIRNSTVEAFLISGEYQLRISGSVSPPSYSIHFKWNNDTHVFYAGGLRVKRIINSDPFAPDRKVIKRYEYLQSENNSSGFMQGLSQYCYDMEDYYSHDCDPSPLGLIVEQPYSIQYVIRTSTSNNPMMLPEGSIVGYSKVTEYLGEEGDGGKKEYFFKTVNDAPDLQHLNFPFGNGENYEFYRGRLYNEKTYKYTGSGFQLLQETVKNIMVLSEFSTSTSKIGFNPQVIRQPVVPFPLSFGIVRQPGKINTARFFESENRSIEYDPNSPGLQLENYTKVISISPVNYLPTHTVTFGSKEGEEIHQYTTYTQEISSHLPSTGLAGTSSDVMALAGILQLALKGKFESPAEVIIVKKRGDGRMYVIEGTLYFYNPLVPELSAIYKLETDVPILYEEFIPCFIHPGVGNTPAELRFDSRYKKKVTMNVYDDKGNVLLQKKTGDVSMMYIWDYDKTLPTAEVIFPKSHFLEPMAYGDMPVSSTNAVVPGGFIPYCAYTSFETDDGGNWKSNEPIELIDPSKEGIKAVTGNKVYNFSGSGYLRFDHLLPAEEYYITIWCHDFPPQLKTNIPGYYTPQILTSRNGWTLYRYQISGTTSVSVSGKGYADELRLYPVYGRMTTYTYEPLIGITSNCDENNNVIYYQYDALGRLKMIQDKDFNILKIFDYKFQQ